MIAVSRSTVMTPPLCAIKYCMHYSVFHYLSLSRPSRSTANFNKSIFNFLSKLFLGVNDSVFSDVVQVLKYITMDPFDLLAASATTLMTPRPCSIKYSKQYSFVHSSSLSRPRRSFPLKTFPVSWVKYQFNLLH